MGANEYDRIMKENIEPILLPFAQKMLGLQGAKYTSIKDDLHVTIERKPDFLKKVKEISKSKSYILHIEFQSTDEKIWYIGCWSINRFYYENSRLR